MDEERVKILIDQDEVSGLWRTSPTATAGLILAHGAGGGMRHRFMANIASVLAEKGLATLRYQFPYMEAGRNRPDQPKRAVATVRAAANTARRLAPDLPLFAGGKSFGGRMTSLAESEAHLEGVSGLVFFGFPLHPPGKPNVDRAAHLDGIKIPMLFLQGTRDSLADASLTRSVCGGLGGGTELRMFEQADHSFHVPKKSGRTDAEIMADMIGSVAAWTANVEANVAGI